MDELVSNNVVTGLYWPRKREDDPALRRFSDSSRALPELAFDGVGLPEIRTAGVQNQRLTAAQLMPQEARQTRVPALGQPRGHSSPFLFLWIEIDVEVLGLQQLEVELSILNFVASEVASLRKRGRWRREHESDEKRGSDED